MSFNFTQQFSRSAYRVKIFPSERSDTLYTYEENHSLLDLSIFRDITGTREFWEKAFIRLESMWRQLNTTERLRKLSPPLVLSTIRIAWIYLSTCRFWGNPWILIDETWTGRGVHMNVCCFGNRIWRPLKRLRTRLENAERNLMTSID